MVIVSAEICSKQSHEIHRSIRLHPRRTCKQEYVGLSNAILHNSAGHAKHTPMHVGLYSVRLLVVQWVMIGQYAMGRRFMDLSIAWLVMTRYKSPQQSSMTCESNSDSIATRVTILKTWLNRGLSHDDK